MRDDGGLICDVIDWCVGVGIYMCVFGVEFGVLRGVVRRVRRGVEIRGVIC